MNELSLFTGAEVEIRKAKISEMKSVVFFIDNTFTKEGFGFVTSAQIETEIWRGAVWVALNQKNIIGVRTGKNTVYNLAVHPEYRNQGIGKALIEIYHADTIRVKAIPVGHLSKEQKTNFKSPRKFYEKIGYIFSHFSWPKNIWAGEKAGKRIFIPKGEKKHIEVYENINPKQLKLFNKR